MADTFRCASCGDEPVSAPGQVCAECLPEHRCATCLGPVEPGQDHCSAACREEDLAGWAADSACDIHEAA